MTRASKSAAKASSSPLVLSYDVAELPSSQHRAGLAGLVLTCHWLTEQAKHELRGVCEIEELSPRRLRLRLDRAGLGSLLDQVYGAQQEERPYSKPWKDKEPLYQRTREEVNEKTKKVKQVTDYYYPIVVPQGSYRLDWENGDQNGVWIKLWRDMIWSILRGRPTTRKPFEKRAEYAKSAQSDAADPDGADPKETRDLFDKLGQAQAVVDLPSTYYLGAQAKTAENVGFRDLARNQFLLNFWPLVAQLYVPVSLDNEGKREFQGFAIAVPDIADLDIFCQELPPAMRQRESKIDGYIPAAAVIDIAAESGLDLLARLSERLRHGTHHQLDVVDLVYGVDVFHVLKAGNNVNTLGVERIDVDPRKADHYQRIRTGYSTVRFRRQRLLNLMADRPWYAGFGRIMTQTPWKQLIGIEKDARFFARDVRLAFTKIESKMQTDDNEKPIEVLVYELIGRYLSARLKSKYDLEWDKVKDSDSQKKEYNDKRQKIAKDAFLAIRSRNLEDFRTYFAGTIFSEPQRLGEDKFVLLAKELSKNPENIRILTMLALSARA